MILDRELLIKSRIPKAYWELNAQTYPGDMQTLREVDAYCQNPCTGLYVYGDACSGKTFMLSYIGRYLLGKGVNYYTFDEAVIAYFENSFKPAGSYLLLDDLSVATGAQYGKVFQYVVKNFPNRGIKLVIASAVDCVDLAKAYGETHADIILRNCKKIASNTFRHKLQTPC